MEDDSCVLNYIEIVPLDSRCSDADTELRPLKVRTNVTHFSVSLHFSIAVRGGLGCPTLARWAGWSAGQVGRNVKC